MITTSAPEIALAILRRRHARLSANSHRLPMPRSDLGWIILIRRWENTFPEARQEFVTETPRKVAK